MAWLAAVCAALAIAACAALPRASAPVPRHVETWAYDDGCNGGAGAPATLVRRWVTFAESNCGSWSARRPGKAMRDCHANDIVYCRVMEYLNADVIYRNTLPAGFSPRGEPESWFLHDPSPNQRYRLVAPAAEYGGGWAMNPLSRGYQRWLARYVNRHFPGVDGLFMDAEGAALPFAGLSAHFSYEIRTSAALRAAHAAMARALRRPQADPYPQVDNTIPDCGNPYEHGLGVGRATSMLRAPVIGLLAEGCPESFGSLTPYLPELLDDIAYVERATGGFVVLLSYGTAGAATQARSRRVTEATLLLAYRPGRVVVWPELEQGSGHLSIWPEEGLYPTDPIQSMRRPAGAGCLAPASGVACAAGGHNDLEVARALCPGEGASYPCGVFRREFGACYERGVSIGGCAAILNDTARPVTVNPAWLSQRYSTVMTLVGGDVQSGGRLDVDGALFRTASTVIAPFDALLLGGASR